MGNYKWQSILPIVQKEYIQGLVDITDEGDRIRYFPSIDQLSERHEIPLATLQSWSTTYGWAQLRQQFQERQNAELLEDTDWYLQERVRTDSLTISIAKSLMRVLRQEIDSFEQQQEFLEGSITQIEKNGRIISTWARTVKDLKVAAELSLTNKDGSPKTMGEGVGRSSDEIEKEMSDLIKRLSSMR